MCWGPEQVNIINLHAAQGEQDELVAGHIEKKFILDKDYFSAIKDVQFVSRLDDDEEVVYECEVACRMNDSTSLGLVPFPPTSANTLPTLSARLSDGTANKVQRWYARTTCQIFLQ